MLGGSINWYQLLFCQSHLGGIQGSTLEEEEKLEV